MDPNYLFALLNPVMSLIYIGVFLSLWRYRSSDRYLLVMVGCHLMVALGFLLQVVALPIGDLPTRAISNVLAISAVGMLSLAFCQRSEVRFPLKIVGLVTAASIAVMAWSLFLQANVVVRIFAVNIGMATIMLTTAAVTFRSTRNAADRILVGLFVTYAILSIVRPLLTLPFDHLPANGDMRFTVYWTVYGFSHAIIAMLFVFAFTTAVALDAIGELQNTTFTDPLSGLANRRGFGQAVDKRLDRALTTRLPVSLILCDLDHFKSINDTYGHRIGDQVIAIFARILKDIVGETHISGRIGGEEFAVLVANGDATTAELIAQGVRVGFSAAPALEPGAGESRRLTASFGIAEWRPGESYADLFGRADVALYEAKRDGRDRVRVSRTAQSDEPRQPAASLDRAATSVAGL